MEEAGGLFTSAVFSAELELRTGRVLVAEDSETAEDFCASVEFPFGWVTSDADVISGGILADVVAEISVNSKSVILMQINVGSSVLNFELLMILCKISFRYYAE